MNAYVHQLDNAHPAVAIAVGVGIILVLYVGLEVGCWLDDRRKARRQAREDEASELVWNEYLANFRHHPPELDAVWQHQRRAVDRFQRFINDHEVKS